MSSTSGTSTKEWKIANVYAPNLPAVNLIPGITVTKSRNHVDYYADISVVDGSNIYMIAKKLYLSTTKHRSSDSISSFQANRTAKLKFKIYASRAFSEKVLGEVEETLEDLLLNCNQDEVILPIVNLGHQEAGQLHFNLQAVVDGKMEDMAEAVAQAQYELSAPPSNVKNASEFVSSLDPVFSDTLNEILKHLQFVQDLGDHLSEIHSYAKLAWSILNFIPKEILKQLETDKDIISLTVTMNDTFDLIRKSENLHRPKSKIILRMVQQTIECGWFIRDYAKVQQFWKRTLKNVGRNTDQKVNEFKEKFAELQSAFQADSTIDVQLAVLRVADDIKGLRNDLTDLTIEGRLSEMRYSRNARFNSEKVCLSGTRTKILDEVFKWVATGASPAGDGQPKSILLLHGMAGTGKSTIAHTIASRLDAMGRLGASFCFSRDDRSDRNAENMFSTIARGIASLDKCFEVRLFEAIKDPGLRSSGVPSEQYTKFILEPMSCLTGIGVVINVIDALDECHNRESILDVLSTREFPENVRFIITTRPEDDIMSHLRGSLHVVTLGVDDIAGQSVYTDVASYILHRFSKAKLQFADSEIQQLVSKADGLFQWAATACNHIANSDRKAGANPRKRLAFVLSQSTGLDSLYRAILTEKFPYSEDEIQSTKSVLAKVLAAAEPLSIEVLKSLCISDDEQQAVDDVIPLLGSVLTIHGTATIRPIHTSFRDYLTDQSRSESFFVDLTQGHQDLALATFAVMKKDLCFNICHIVSSHLPNSSLTPYQLNHISSALFYSCRFWGDHLPHATVDIIQDKISYFMKHQLLFWLEVLSVKMALHVAVPAMDVLGRSGEKTWNDTDLITIAKDMIAFIRSFVIPLQSSAPHIYLSALALSPQSSYIWKNYSPAFGNLLQCTSNIYAQSIQATIHVESKVDCVAISPDEKYIVFSIFWDPKIYVWDAETLRPIGEPLQGHSDRVVSIAFSSDGKHIVSGSSDQTIRLWNVDSKQQIGNPLTGHIGWVTSVDFSSDGKYIVSGGDDHTIRVWNAESLQPIGEPLRGHAKTVSSVAFSSNGKHIVSGSYDQTICVWDVQKMQQIGNPLTGHKNGVTSVAFSPDGKYICSGSYDATICVWDMESKQQVGKPLTGHHEDIYSVAFSSDGKHIVSGSCDQTIRFWNTETLQPVGEPLTDHGAPIGSVTFSSDGKHVVSGSWDQTIRIWNWETMQQIEQPPAGHTNCVVCVAFSLDGKHIVSGSSDKTIRIWDAESLLQIGSPLQCQDVVWSVAFSPDGKTIISGANDLCLWDIDTLHQIGKLSGHKHHVGTVAFSPDGTHIASGSWDSTIRIWNVKSQQQIGIAELPKFEGASAIGDWNLVNSIAFSFDGRHIVSGSSDKLIHVWDVENMQQLGEPLAGHYSEVTSVALSPDGRHIVSSSYDSTICIWDVEMMQQIGAIMAGHSQAIRSVAFSSDGRLIVSGSDDTTICIWDAVRRTQIGKPFIGHRLDVTCVAFSPDGRQVVSSSNDRTLRLWDSDFQPSISRSPLEPFVGGCSYLNPTMTITNDGWVLGPNSELIFWIPAHLLERFPRPFLLGVIGGQPMHQFDASHFVHGKDWVKCTHNDLRQQSQV